MNKDTKLVLIGDNQEQYDAYYEYVICLVYSSKEDAINFFLKTKEGKRKLLNDYGVKYNKYLEILTLDEWFENKLYEQRY